MFNFFGFNWHFMFSFHSQPTVLTVVLMLVLRPSSVTLRIVAK